jgi:cell division protein FtsB
MAATQRRRVLGLSLTAVLLTAYAFTALRGPQGLQALFYKYREIRTLEAQNAAAVVENQRRRERIEQLKTNTSEQEMEIRKQLKLLRPGETTFILPEASKAAEAPQPDPAP